jgi:hypothetical protein
MLMCLVLSTGLELATAEGDSPGNAEPAEFFEKKIRPLLVARCFECHGNGRTKGGLSLASRAGLLAGGESGPAVVPGQTESSLLLVAVRQTGDVQMPPDGKLTPREIADLALWIEHGAFWPHSDSLEAVGAMRVPGRQITAEDREFWSFKPIGNPAAPNVRETHWPLDPIDAFVLAKLEAEGLKPSPPADRRTLIRRVTFDLTGLPATVEEVQAFVNDTRMDAYENVVERLLASPRYGERWARHWLDVARYGEDQAHTFQARLYPNGFRYRDWVVKAFNDDLPYDRFLIEQIAGDLLNGPEGDEREKQQRLTALGFFALGPVYYNDNACVAKAALDELDDRIDTLTRGVMGLTVACARCHDHKYDPITQDDYYALAGVFASSKYCEAPLAPQSVVDEYNLAQDRINTAQKAVEKVLQDDGVRLAEAGASDLARYLSGVWKLRYPPAGQSAPDAAEMAQRERLSEFTLKRWQRFLTAENKGKLPLVDGWIDLAMAAAEKPDDERAMLELQAAELAAAFQTAVVAALAERNALELRVADVNADAAQSDQVKTDKPQLEKPKADLIAAVFTGNGPSAVPRDEVEALLDDDGKRRLAALRSELEQLKKVAPPKYAFAHSLTEGKVANMPLHLRGNPAKTGDEVPRRMLAVASGDDAPAFVEGSGRLELARAIAGRDNPLTARVIVNRLWQHHFGSGLVGTPGNFGALGERPSHGELLDHLAHALIEQGWSLKALHRRTVTSATYRQSSLFDAQAFELDPNDRLLWRFPRRRLDVESWRDAVLAVAGNLDEVIGGPPQGLDVAGNRRRTLYGAVSRHNLDSLLRLFDFPDPNITADARIATTVPLQQLFVLNSEFMVAGAKALAARLATSGVAGEQDDARVRRAIQLVYGRPANDGEVSLALEFLAAQPSVDGDQISALARWEQYCQALLGANEFWFVD